MNEKCAALVEFYCQKKTEVLKKKPCPSVILMTVIFNSTRSCFIYEGWNFNSGNYLFTTDTK